VTNNPLPVNIANTPTVNANIGTPTVNINGTPTVNVNSSATAPVYVDTEGARKAFNASCFTGNVDPVYGTSIVLAADHSRRSTDRDRDDLMPS
jgi:hypothetical protein